MSTASRSTKRSARHGAWAWVGVGVAVVTGTAYLDFFIGPVRWPLLVRISSSQSRPDYD